MHVDDHISDKTETKALRASELRYRRLFESARDGILILDAKTGQVVDVNPFLCASRGHALFVVPGYRGWGQNEPCHFV